MKLGPFHVVKERTYRALAGSSPNTFQVHTFGHYPVNVRVAPPVILEPDTPTVESRQAVDRVIEAYQRAQADFVTNESSVWDNIEGKNKAYIKALERGDRETVQDMLGRMFQTNLVWGLGRLHESVPQQMRDQPRKSDFQMRVTDSLVSLAEAAAVLPLTSAMQQGRERHLEALDRDLEDILRRVESRTGLDFNFPEVGATYGVRIGGKLVTIDTLTHGYAVYRLGQMGATSDSVVAEIGGGYGCLAYQFYGAGFHHYAIYDLPWVNTLQGYFLIRSLPPGSVRLHGEGDGSLRVMPHWCFHRLPKRSVDYVINTNSMPEMNPDTAREYLVRIRELVRGSFLSINQEAQVQLSLDTVDYDAQNWIARMVEEVGGFRVVSRMPYWMFPGYAEEIFEPVGS